MYVYTNIYNKFDLELLIYIFLNFIITNEENVTNKNTIGLIY